MSFYDTTGYRPDYNLAKSMAGGGFAGLAGSFGKNFGDYSKELDAKKQLEFENQDKQDNLALERDKAGLYKKQIEASIDNNKLNREKWDAEQGRVAQDDATAYETIRSKLLTAGESNPKDYPFLANAGLPNYDVVKALPSDAQANIKGNVNDLLGRYTAIQEAKKLAQEQRDKLALEAAKKSDTDIFGKGIKDISVNGNKVKAVHVGGGTFTDGTNVYKAGTYSLWNEPTTEDKMKENELRTQEVAIDQKAWDYVSKAFDDYNDWTTFDGAIRGAANGAKFLYDGVGNYDSELADVAKQQLYKMYVNGEIRDMKPRDALKEAYKRVGAPVGPFGAEMTDETKVKTLTTNIIAGNDAAAITPEIVKQYLQLDGKKVNDEFADKMTLVFKAMADERNNKGVAMKQFADKYGLNESLGKRTSNVLEDAQNNVMNFLMTDLGLGSAGDKKRWADAKANKNTNENWAIGNQSFDVAPLLAEVIKYAPVAGLSPVTMSTRLMSVLANASKFGSAESAMGYVYGDDWKTNAMFAGGAGATLGLFNKIIKPTANASKNTATQASKDPFIKSKMGTPSGNPAYQGTKPNVKGSPLKEGETVDEYIKRIQREMQSK